MLGKNPRGKMLWFNEDKGHGYIETEEGERLYVEGTGFVADPPEGPVAGLVVEFRIVEGPGGRFAECNPLRRRHLAAPRPQARLAVATPC